MLDFHRLAGQFQDFSAYRRDEDRRHADRLAGALDALTACSTGWESLRDAVLAEAAERGRRHTPLRAIPHDAPDGCHACGPRPTPVTVVATDGSQIYPERHVEPTCYLLNVSRVAFHYGTEEPCVIEAVPQLRYRARDLEDLAGEGDDARFDVTVEVVSALRDELELVTLYETAAAERRSGRPVVALADGTLIRWMLRGMKNRALEERLVARYVEALECFRADGLPVASYVSLPANAEVVHLLRFWRGEDDQAPPEDTLRGLLDRHLFERALDEGERSAVFASGSRILDEYGAHHIVYFYVRAGREVGRVEMPQWVAEQPGWVDLLHAVVLDEVEKGGGYPMILSEAHERAVVRAREKDVFYRILERQMRSAGLPTTVASGKAASKRTPRI
ncbi:MAG: DNA double-strand break repair nuclease NurA [Rubricoccaceae bacterium]|nr:DNA double-strand break repair nuclease NurA [Rubricoccaceae bacterium]